MRKDKRSPNAPRPIQVQTGFQHNPEGSVLYQCGGTRVLIAASVEEKVPEFLRGTGGGWVTAEYAMHPRANRSRKKRDRKRGAIDGRSQEIQRLIGRSLRACVHLDRMGERSITIDCDVIDADGGTRTASITGGFIALAMAIAKLKEQGLLKKKVLREPVVAISTGLLKGESLLDLCYEEDRDADVDLNVVGTATGKIVEIQGTAEVAPVEKAAFDSMINLATGSFSKLADAQAEALQRVGIELGSL